MSEPHESKPIFDARAHHTRARLTLLGVVLPIVIALLGTLVFISWLPELPNPVATHWSGSGGPDGFGSAWVSIVIPLGITAVFSAIVAFAMGRSSTPSGGPSLNQKVLAAAGIWMSLLLTIGVGGSIAVQRGLKDAANTPDPGLWLLLGAAVGLVAGALVWFLLPPADRSLPADIEVDELAVAPSERIFWTGVASMSTRVLVLIGAVVLLTLSAVVVAATAGSGGVASAVSVAVVVLIASSFIVRWRISTGSHGLSAVSVLGWPSVRVALADIVEVRLIDVNATADFGGWGWRWAGGRTGIILHGGPAIEVTRRGKRTLVIPVTDAATAVSVLRAALAQQTPPA